MQTNLHHVLFYIKEKYAAKTKRHKLRKATSPVYRRVYNVLKDGIINNHIPPLTVLPPSRMLASTLNISRSTVNKAYDLLKLEGFIEAKHGSKHIVNRLHHTPSNFQLTPLQEVQYPELSEIGKSFKSNINLINSTDDKSIAFRPGLPPLDVFPVNQWKNLSNLYWRYIKSSSLSYSSTSGIHQLKLNIANYLNLSRGIKCEAEQIIIVSGSLQSLYLVGSTLLNPGDHVSIENPTFPNVLSIFKGLRARVNPLAVDEDGVQTKTLENDHARSKLLHVTPRCHYPTGVSLSKQRKLDILNWANTHNSFIIENDYEHELQGSNDASLFALDTQQRVIYLSTFNRLLHPSIRIGFMILPPYLLGTVEALMKHSHRFVPPSIQVVLHQFMEKNYLHGHLKNVLEAAENRHQVFSEVFNNELGDLLKIKTDKPKSLQILAETKFQPNDRFLVQALEKENILAHAYSKCFVDGAKKQGLILGYSSVRPPVIKQKVQHMAKVLRKHLN